MDRIDLFRIFVRVAEAGSFTRAADALGLSRPTVSVAIQTLEARIGARLLNRTTRRVSTTQEGKQLFERCQRAIEEIEEIEGLFDAKASTRGELRVEMPGRVGRLLVAPRLPEFLAQHPGLTIMLGATDRAVDLYEMGIDCALRVGPLPDSGMIARGLGSLPLVTVAAPSYLAEFGEPAAPADLAAHKMVHYASPTSGRVEPFEWFDGKTDRQVPVSGAVAVNSAEALIACSLAGLGLIQVPAYDVRDHLRRNELVEILPGYRASPLPVHLLFPDRRYIPRRALVFAEWISELMREHTVPGH